ncbi:mitochondrial fission 1 protein-like [Limulus polyphemus]|uniref:Mitochondrial fission 1 protein n=1 Tax=Limulus polyphemus TaxID=6850 RepID=A0ABM1BHT9_LIMPO|nr:mitochondrial fission 1 protein-like [Limulus polyphemus]
MEPLLEDYVSPDDLKKFEELYHNQLKHGNLTSKTQFEYAWCLIRSHYPADIRRGVVLLEDLFTHGDDNAKRDYLFYLGVGNTKLKEYNTALRYVKNFLSVEPANRQAQELEAYIKSRMRKEGLMGMAIVGGAAIALGGLVGLGVALSKK